MPAISTLRGVTTKLVMAKCDKSDRLRIKIIADDTYFMLLPLEYEMTNKIIINGGLIPANGDFVAYYIDDPKHTHEILELAKLRSSSPLPSTIFPISRVLPPPPEEQFDNLKFMENFFDDEDEDNITSYRHVISHMHGLITNSFNSVVNSDGGDDNKFSLSFLKDLGRPSPIWEERAKDLLIQEQRVLQELVKEIRGGWDFFIFHVSRKIRVGDYERLVVAAMMEALEKSSAIKAYHMIAYDVNVEYYVHGAPGEYLLQQMDPWIQPPKSLDNDSFRIDSPYATRLRKHPMQCLDDLGEKFFRKIIDSHQSGEVLYTRAVLCRSLLITYFFQSFLSVWDDCLSNGHLHLEAMNVAVPVYPKIMDRLKERTRQDEVMRSCRLLIMGPAEDEAEAAVPETITQLSAPQLTGSVLEDVEMVDAAAMSEQSSGTITGESKAQQSEPVDKTSKKTKKAKRSDKRKLARSRQTPPTATQPEAADQTEEPAQAVEAIAVDAMLTDEPATLVTIDDATEAGASQADEEMIDAMRFGSLSLLHDLAVKQEDSVEEPSVVVTSTESNVEAQNGEGKKTQSQETAQSQEVSSTTAPVSKSKAAKPALELPDFYEKPSKKMARRRKNKKSSGESKSVPGSQPLQSPIPGASEPTSSPSCEPEEPEVPPKSPPKEALYDNEEEMKLALEASCNEPSSWTMVSNKRGIKNDNKQNVAPPRHHHPAAMFPRRPYQPREGRGNIRILPKAMPVPSSSTSTAPTSPPVHPVPVGSTAPAAPVTPPKTAAPAPPKKEEPRGQEKPQGQQKPQGQEKPRGQENKRPAPRKTPKQKKQQRLPVLSDVVEFPSLAQSSVMLQQSKTGRQDRTVVSGPLASVDSKEGEHEGTSTNLNGLELNEEAEPDTKVEVQEAHGDSAEPAEGAEDKAAEEEHNEEAAASVVESEKVVEGSDQVASAEEKAAILPILEDMVIPKVLTKKERKAAAAAKAAAMAAAGGRAADKLSVKERAARRRASEEKAAAAQSAPVAESSGVEAAILGMALPATEGRVADAGNSGLVERVQPAAPETPTDPALIKAIQSNFHLLPSYVVDRPVDVYTQRRDDPSHFREHMFTTTAGDLEVGERTSCSAFFLSGMIRQSATERRLLQLFDAKRPIEPTMVITSPRSVTDSNGNETTTMALSTIWCPAERRYRFDSLLVNVNEIDPASVMEKERTFARSRDGEFVTDGCLYTTDNTAPGQIFYVTNPKFAPGKPLKADGSACQIINPHEITGDPIDLSAIFYQCSNLNCGKRMAAIRSIGCARCGCISTTRYCNLDCQWNDLEHWKVCGKTTFIGGNVYPAHDHQRALHARQTYVPPTIDGWRQQVAHATGLGTYTLFMRVDDGFGSSYKYTYQVGFAPGWEGNSFGFLTRLAIDMGHLTAIKLLFRWIKRQIKRKAPVAWTDETFKSYVHAAYDQLISEFGKDWDKDTHLYGLDDMTSAGTLDEETVALMRREAWRVLEQDIPGFVRPHGYWFPSRNMPGEEGMGAFGHPSRAFGAVSKLPAIGRGVPRNSEPSPAPGLRKRYAHIFTMANDSDPKDQPVAAPAEESKQDPPTPASTPAEPAAKEPEQPLSRAALIEQAFRFLGESDVRNSTRTKKIAFLESKGLTRAEIDSLLPVEKGVPSWQFASAATNKTDIVQAEPPMAPMPTSETTAAGKARRAAEAALEVAKVPASVSSIPQNLPPRPAGRAPIVTFPEYIPPPPPPPPIFNTQTLTAGAYLFAGVSATVYAATKYYFQPLLDNLTDARLEFSSHTLSKLDEMNAQLSALAHRPLPSETHPNPPFGVLQHKYPLAKLPRHSTTDLLDDLDGDLAADASDVESIYSYASTSPPTRTFHVDAQTQTSPHRSVASVDDTTALPPDEKLDRIQRLLKSLKDEAEDVVAAEGGELGGNVKDLTEYLHTITYKATYGGAGGPNSANAYLPPYVSIAGGAGAPGKNDEDDFAKVKAEIRSVKGVLLNIKNFPAGSR
ncbi:hypothetical protein Dda_4469 [Drechslerella dactyloides]|uniref:Peroxisome membrane anchor protein Pex14p N-terminal domain-containing protein n=1 Tax=Drechslerella dactyloides TaxID=74499 RepID=A0AAD6NJB1_DREDA|nr:hypothetical protein Dda_4469 [Drechslerella dactyloides]